MVLTRRNSSNSSAIQRRIFYFVEKTTLNRETSDNRFGEISGGFRISIQVIFAVERCRTEE